MNIAHCAHSWVAYHHTIFLPFLFWTDVHIKSGAWAPIVDHALFAHTRQMLEQIIPHVGVVKANADVGVNAVLCILK